MHLANGRVTPAGFKAGLWEYKEHDERIRLYYENGFFCVFDGEKIHRRIFIREARILFDSL